MDQKSWLDTAVSGIRFGPDRRAVLEELEGHFEDKIADLRRVFPDIPEAEARERALRGMGDPEELKISLARVHKPWLGYLWRYSQVLAAAALALVLLLWGGRALENWVQQLEQKRAAEDAPHRYHAYTTDCYQAGIDPFRADGPYPTERRDVIRTPLAALRPEDSAQAGGYRFQVKRAGLFRFQSDPEDPGRYWLFCELRAAGLPWEPVSQDALWHLRAVDSSGREYASPYEVYDLKLQHGSYMIVSSGKGSWLEARFDLTMIDLSPGIEWIRLEYDRLGVRWSLTIPLETEGGGKDG